MRLKYISCTRGVKENQHTKDTHVYIHICTHSHHTHKHTNTQLRYTEIGFTTSGVAPEQELGVVYSDVQNVAISRTSFPFVEVLQFEVKY